MKTLVLGAFLMAVSGRAQAQVLYVGVKGGTPLSDSTASGMGGGRGGIGLSTLNIRRYTIGPTVEAWLPFGLHVEVDALYKRLDRTDHRFLSATFGNITRLAAGTWEFPVLIKYSRNLGRYRPSAGVGGTFRRIGSFGRVERMSRHHTASLCEKQLITERLISITYGHRSPRS